MTYKVLVVDDSSFFQIRLKEIINEHPELEVVGIASNGNEAIDMAEKLQPDVISMDYEMPYLNGVSAIKGILAARSNVPIIMFSSMTYEGAHTTLECLDAGAVDFIPKNFAEVSKNAEGLKKKLHDTFIAFARKLKADAVLAELRSNKPGSIGAEHRKATPSARSSPTPSVSAPSSALSVGATARGTQATAPKAHVGQRDAAAPIHTMQRKMSGRIDLVIIGSSTGGPVALTEVLTRIPANYKCPIVVIQHMPENFTKALADRLDKQCQVSVKEASNGDTLAPGKVFVAPGGHQCIFDRYGKIKILDADERVTYKPSVDVTFASAASIYGAKILGVVLTGMGADGCEGARLLKEKGAFIWGQDQASCVVYGMPKAVAEAQLTDRVLKLSDIGDRIVSDT